MTSKLTRYAIIAAASLMLPGCHIYNKYEMPVSESSRLQAYSDALHQQPDSASLPFMGWQQVFTDPILQGYIRTALAENTDLENARLNIDIAKAQLKGAKLSYIPAFSLGPNGGTAKYGNSDMNWSYSIPLSASWEIDAFGKILNRKRGAKVTVEQMEDYRSAVQSQIVCGVAQTYYALVMLQQQLGLTKRTAEIWKEQVESMQLMKEAARVNEAAVVQSRANYYNILSTIPDLEQSIHQTQNSLSLLLNSDMREWEVTSDLDFSLPVAVTQGIPMSYLAARPDVAAAERGLAKAYYATNSARANFYPNLTISAQGGFTNLLGSIVVNPGKWFVQLAGSLVAPIFSRGQNIATLEAAKAQQKQAMLSFESTVLSASADVSDALVKISKNTTKREYILLQIDQLEKSVEYTEELLTLGQSTYLEVLTARSSLLSAQMGSLQCWHDKVTALISLYSAVGGGR